MVSALLGHFLKFSASLFLNISESALGKAHKSADIVVAEIEGANVKDELCRNDSNNEAPSNIEIGGHANEDVCLNGSVVFTNNYFYI